MNISRSASSFLFAPPAARKAIAKYTNLGGSAVLPPGPFLLSATVSEVSDLLANRWQIRWLSPDGSAAISQIATLVRSHEHDLANGWIVASPGALSFEATYILRPRYTSAQLVSIAQLLADIARALDL